MQENCIKLKCGNFLLGHAPRPLPPNPQEGCGLWPQRHLWTLSSNILAKSFSGLKGKTWLAAPLTGIIIMAWLDSCWKLRSIFLEQQELNGILFIIP